MPPHNPGCTDRNTFDHAARLIAERSFPKALDLLLPYGPSAVCTALYDDGAIDGDPHLVQAHKEFWKFWVDWLLMKGSHASLAVLECLESLEGELCVELTYADDTAWWLRNVQVLRAAVIQNLLASTLQGFSEHYPGEAIPEATADRLQSAAQHIATIVMRPTADEDAAARTTQGEYWPEQLPLFWHKLPDDWNTPRHPTGPYFTTRDPHEVERHYNNPARNKNT